MRAVDVFLRQFDEAWQHEWESLRPLLEGVTEEEATWQAPCYRDAPVDHESDPPPGTIHWHVVHLAICKHSYTARMLGVEPQPLQTAGGYTDAVAQLETTHAEQRKVIASLSDDDLERKLTNGVAMDEYLTSTIRHDIWHAGQIALARRLWQNR